MSASRHSIFVYGTLMRNQRANDMLQSCRYEGKYLLKDYAMYHLGRYPGIKPCIGESVVGELYDVDEATLAQMDAYEGNGSLYHRTPVTVTREGEERSAEVYVYARSIAGMPLMREPWGAADSDLVWYAGYGSNLSTQRFACYISGGICPDNGKRYRGASDPTPPREVKKRTYPGRLYFGNSSGSWGGGGVAFFDPGTAGQVHMRLYRITRAQLRDVQQQEGPGRNWYGRLACLEVDRDGIPVYTLTSEVPRPRNTPSPAYLALIKSALCRELSLDEAQAEGYLRGWM